MISATPTHIILTFFFYRRLKEGEDEAKRRLEAEQLRLKEEAKKKLEAEELNLKEEARRRMEAEQLRLKEEREEQELKYQQLRLEEEAMRLEEMRLEQELRRQFELCQEKQQLQQQDQQWLLQQQQQQQEQQQSKQKNLNQHTQKLKKEVVTTGQPEPMVVGEETKAASSPAPRRMRTKSWSITDPDKGNSCNSGTPADPVQLLGKVKTGQVIQRRNFWIRSSSTDRLGEAAVAAATTSSPAPRRRQLDKWNHQPQKTDHGGEDGGESSRPGSALGHHLNTGSVKQLTSGLLARSKSTAALTSWSMSNGPPLPPSRTTAWTKEKFDQQAASASSCVVGGLKSSIKLEEVRTNQVADTLTTWTARQEGASPVPPPPAAERCPSSNIGHGFAENLSLRRPEMERRPPNSWRSRATPEPSLRLVNVSVSGKTVTTKRSTVTTESSVVTATTNLAAGLSEQQEASCDISRESQKSVRLVGATPLPGGVYGGDEVRERREEPTSGTSVQPPPTPERNQSFAGESCHRSAGRWNL